MEFGTPLFGPASNAYDHPIKKGHIAEAKALEILVTSRSWSGGRLFEEGIISLVDARCLRCGAVVGHPLAL